MSAGNEDGIEGGQNAPSGDVVPGAAAVLQIASHLAKSALGRQGKLVPSAAVQLALRDPDARRKLLEEVIVEVCPDGVDEGLWLDWLQGGKSPFEVSLRKVSSGSDGPTRLLARSTPRLRSQEKKVERKRAELEAEERELEVVRAYENAAVHWHVVDQLCQLVMPAFAMGPAWTLMRAISAHLSDEKAQEETCLEFGDAQVKAIEKLRADRASETAMVLEVLDLGSGREDFEADVRAALVKVCSNWNKQRDKLTADGRKPRSFEAAVKEAHPKAQADKVGVLEGLKKAS